MVYWGLNFMICFNFFFMRLSQSHDLGHWFDKLNWLTHFFLLIFFNFIIQYFIDLKLGFMICFDLLSIRLSRTHNLSHWFSRLTMMDLSHFFSPFTLIFLKISSFNIRLIKNCALYFFYLLSIELFQLHD